MASETKIIDLGPRLRRHRELAAHDAAELAAERIRNLAYQAMKLPTTLSRSEIAELGRAVWAQVQGASRTV